ncbi:MAG: histidine--tRNA ligase, partial [Chlamydiia bacterium]|nr:histidine--tRNA ligase [Chlamydiia bacterium]
LDEKAKNQAIKFLYELRHAHISAEMILAKKIQKGLQQAEQMKAQHVVILGADELEKKAVQIKTMESRTTEDIPLSKLVDTFIKRKDNGL